MKNSNSIFLDKAVASSSMGCMCPGTGDNDQITMINDQLTVNSKRSKVRQSLITVKSGK